MAETTTLAERYAATGARLASEARLSTQPRLIDWTESAVAPPTIPEPDDPSVSQAGT